MSAVALLARLHSHGIALRADGESLHYSPRDALTQAQLAELRRYKRELLALLAADDAAIRWRVTAMIQRHPPPWSGVPFLTVCDVPRTRPGCRSCGGAMQLIADCLAVRCVHCMNAAHLIVSRYRDATKNTDATKLPSEEDTTYGEQ
jgi:hypothetical protein